MERVSLLPATWQELKLEKPGKLPVALEEHANNTYAVFKHVSKNFEAVNYPLLRALFRGKREGLLQAGMGGERLASNFRIHLFRWEVWISILLEGAGLVGPRSVLLLLWVCSR